MTVVSHSVHDYTQADTLPCNALLPRNAETLAIIAEFALHTLRVQGDIELRFALQSVQYTKIKSTTGTLSPMPMPRAPAKRGRPARVSRQDILKAALKVLQKGDASLTMTGLARALDVAPMTLYGHVRNRDDLIEGVSALVLDQLDLRIDPRNSWQEQLLMWMEGVRAHLSHYPQVVRLLGQGHALPLAWVRLQSELIRILQSAGFREAALADAARWVPHYTIGAIMVSQARGASGAPRVEAAQVKTLLPQLTAEERAAMSAVLPYLKDPPRLQRFTDAQVVKGLEKTLQDAAETPAVNSPK